MTGRFPKAIPLLGAVVLNACASNFALSPRDYGREGLKEVPIQSVALVALSAEPARMTGPQIRVDAFHPPRVDQALNAGRSLNEATAELLRSAALSTLRERGFQAKALTTSSEATLADAFEAAAEQDVLLVLRAVPLDQLYVREDSAVSQLVDASSGDEGTGIQLPQGEGVANLTPGRLFLGQLFLFDVQTKARLWSRQLPGYPQDDTLRPEAELLRYGLAGEAARGLSPRGIVGGSAQAFVTEAMRSFPSPQKGSLKGEQMLAKVDVAGEARSEAFFDAQHLAIELGTGWTYERIETSVQLDEETSLPSLTTGALAPSGAFQLLQLRVSWLTAGGLSLSAHGTFGTIPTDFERRVVRADDPDTTQTLGTQRVGDAQVIGGGLGLGQLIGLGGGFFLHPGAVLYLEQWSYDVTPSAAFSASDHGRFGVEGRFDLWWTPNYGPLLLRIGGLARAGVDTAGPVYFGGGASLGVGALF